MPINSIPQKLRIKEGDIILVLNPPVGFKEKLGKVPDRVSIVNSAKNYNQVHWFVKDRAQMEEELKKVLFLITGYLLLN